MPRPGTSRRAGAGASWNDADRLARKRAVTSVFVERNATDRVAEIIDKLRGNRLAGKEAACMMLTGEPGVGKTTFLKRYESWHPLRRGVGGRLLRPVLYVGFQSQTSPIGAAKTLLRKLFVPKLGHEDAESLTAEEEERLERLCRGNLTDLTFRVKEQLNRQEVEAVLNDDFHHVANRGAAKSVSAAADWVKEVVKDTRVPFIMAGVGAVTRLVKQNRELADVTPRRLELGRLLYDTEPHKLASREFLAKLDTGLPFDRPCRFADPDTAFCIMQATEGYLRRITHLIHHAAFAAIDRGASWMTTDDLAAGFEEIAALSPLERNPFAHDRPDLYAGEGPRHRP